MSKSLEIRLIIEITIMKVPDLNLPESDVIWPVKYNPEINNIENIVAVYKNQVKTSQTSPPYSKKSMTSQNSPIAISRVGKSRERHTIPKI